LKINVSKGANKNQKEFQVFVWMILVVEILLEL
jgi:hypothetical protein